MNRIPSLKHFSNSKWEFLAYKNEKLIFKSRGRSIKPLLKYLNSKSTNKIGAVIFDKIVGRASALLISLSRPKAINTPILSESGIKVLKSHHISYNYKKRVEFIMGYTSQELCRWEKLAKGQTAEGFLKLVKKP